MSDNAPMEASGLTLTPAQQRQWNDTTAMMAWVAPGFRHIWFKMLTHAQRNGKSEYAALMSESVPVAATDGNNMIVNPKTFFDYSLRQRVFIAAHEVMHNIFDDVGLLHRCTAAQQVPMNDGRKLPFENMTMQIAMDLRNNTLLKESNIGQCPDDAMMPGKEMDGVQLPFVTGHESVLDIYDKVYQAFDQKKGQQPGAGTAPQLKDVLPPGNSTGQAPQQAASQRNAQQWAIEIAAAQTLEAMKAQGDMPAGLKRMFEQLLTPEINWLDHIETLIQRLVGSGSTTWREPDPWYIGRDIYLPRKTGYGAGWIVIWGDTSGSRSDKEIASNLSELSGLLEDVNPRRLTVLWCDAHVDYIDEIADASDLQNIQARGTGGGGGTSFEPVLDWISEQEDTPELFIGFTDGAVNFPAQEPPFQTIWASSTDCQYPYGKVVRVNKAH